MTAPTTAALLQQVGVVNCRDLAFMPTRHGPVAPDRLLRCASLAHLPNAALRGVIERVPRALYVDLRTDSEIARGGRLEAAVAAGWRWLRMPIDEEQAQATPGGLTDRVAEVVDRLAALADQEEALPPLLVACSLGKDRTGLVVAHLLLRLGCPQAAVLQDYLASNSQLLREAERLPARFRPDGGGYGAVTETAFHRAFPGCIPASGRIGALARHLCAAPRPTPQRASHRGAARLHRRRHDLRLNLSSNILLHDALVPLLDDAWRHVEPTVLARYPDFATAADAVAERLCCMADALLLTPGTDAAIRAIVANEAHRTGGLTRVLLQDPNYYAWEQAVPACGLTLDRIGWTRPEDQGVSLIDAAARSNPALVALSFPNGPIGGGMRLAELDTLVEICHVAGHRLVVDTCYAAFDRSLPDLRGRWPGEVLVMTSLSKSHGLAGCRFGTVCGAPSWIAELADSRLEHTVSVASVTLALRMMDNGPALGAIWDDIAEARRIAAETLAAADLAPLPSGGNFLTFRLPTQSDAERLEAAMSALGYRLKSLAGLRGYETALRITVAQPARMRSVLVDLLATAGEIGVVGAARCL